MRLATEESAGERELLGTRNSGSLNKETSGLCGIKEDSEPSPEFSVYNLWDPRKVS